MSKILDKINLPEDFHSLSNEELEILGGDIREFLIEKVSKTGGHLAPNLGVVELTLSLFKTFDFKSDKIVWDVGHQSYVYKILTGRKDGFDKLRKHEGLSGFPKRNESHYDYFDTGHSSTSISAALGMARARDIKKENHKVVAVIGDGALTGGMTFEALNDVGYNKTDMVIIVNDNGMSISCNVGGMSAHLNNLRMGPTYNKIKNDVGSTLDSSGIGRCIHNSLSKIKDSIKQLVVPSMLFEEMGIKYIGPIDGHNIKLMNEVLNRAKNLKGPVLIHTITHKGKGYSHAENSPEKFHGVPPFNSETGEPLSISKNSYSSSFGKALCDIAREDESVVAITAAMPDGTGIANFKKLYEERFFDVGIAEQHAVTLAAGMATSGIKPVFAVYSTFLQRAYDQVLHDICIQNLPVVLCLDRAGIVGEDGETHQGIFDLSYLSSIPNLRIMAPKCISEIKPLLKYALSLNEPVAIRYPRGGDMIDGISPLKEFSLGKWEWLKKEQEELVILATGKMVQHALLASELLKRENIRVSIVNATFVKPMDMKMLDEISKEFKTIITMEDNVIRGGFGEGILSYLNKKSYKGNVYNLGYDDKFVNQGHIDILYTENGLSPEKIYDFILKLNEGESNGR
ncbi:MAG: 1-deoxy-D-xylulose-5-phosphate synthase [Clostridium sp.]